MKSPRQNLQGQQEARSMHVLEADAEWTSNEGVIPTCVPSGMRSKSIRWRIQSLVLAREAASRTAI